MKKIVSIMLVALMLIGMLSACGGEKKESEKEEPITIVGTWEYGSMGAAYIFNEDGTGTYTFSGTDMNFTYTDDGSKLIIQYENADNTNEFSYTIEGKTLHIEDSFGSIVDYTRK